MKAIVFRKPLNINYNIICLSHNAYVRDCLLSGLRALQAPQWWVEYTANSRGKIKIKKLKKIIVDVPENGTPRQCTGCCRKRFSYCTKTIASKIPLKKVLPNYNIELYKILDFPLKKIKLSLLVRESAELRLGTNTRLIDPIKRFRNQTDFVRIIVIVAL